MEVIGTFRLHLKTGFYLDLFETFVVSSFIRNLISISNLDKFDFSCSLGNNKEYQPKFKFDLFRFFN